MNVRTLFFVVITITLVAPTESLRPQPIAAQETPRTEAPRSSASPLHMRISLENSADHVQAISVTAFARALEAGTAGRIRVEVHHSGTLFRDQDVFRALNRGQVEMAVPGTWHVSRYAPDVSIFLLPQFFGRDMQFVHRRADGPLGREIARRVEVQLDVVVPGRWMDLGHGHLFFADHHVTSHEELAGLTIRVAGGRANELRVAALGANPVTVAWGELPWRLAQRQVDGLLTTWESVRTARLWEQGLRYALEDFQYMPQYIPIIRRSFWDQIEERDRKTLGALWEEQVDQQRVAARRAQESARAHGREQGITVTVVPAPVRAMIRRRLLEQQGDLAVRLGIDPALLDQL